MPSHSWVGPKSHDPTPAMVENSSSRRPLILFAMKEEMASLRLSCSEVGWNLSRDGHRSVLNLGCISYDVVVTGPGRMNICDALSGLHPAAIINPGFAGSINPSFQLGDVARIDGVRCGSQSQTIDMSYLPTPTLRDARIVTVPEPLGAKDKRKMHEDGAGDLIDMETYHVLQFCQDRGIPYFGLRAVSDDLTDELPRVLKDSFDGRRFRLLPIVMKGILSRSTRQELLKLRRHSQLAARKLALALIGSLKPSNH